MEEELCFDLILGQVPRHVEGLVARAIALSPSRPSGSAKNDGASADILGKFLSSKVPGIKISDYVKRFHAHSEASPASFVLAWIYLDRLVQRTQADISPRHIHRLLFTAWMTACKFADDHYKYAISLYCKIGGIKSPQVLLGLEAEFVCLLGFDLVVGEEEFRIYLERLGQIKCAQGELRFCADEPCADDLFPEPLPLSRSTSTDFERQESTRNKPYFSCEKALFRDYKDAGPLTPVSRLSYSISSLNLSGDEIHGSREEDTLDFDDSAWYFGA